MAMQSLLLYQDDHIAEQEGRGEIVGFLIFGVIPILAFRVITSTKRSNKTAMRDLEIFHDASINCWLSNRTQN